MNINDPIPKQEFIKLSKSEQQIQFEQKIASIENEISVLTN